MPSSIAGANLPTYWKNAGLLLSFARHAPSFRHLHEVTVIIGEVRFLDLVIGAILSEQVRHALPNAETEDGFLPVVVRPVVLCADNLRQAVLVEDVRPGSPP